MGWAVLLFLTSCSAPDLSLAGEAGCSTSWSTGADSCGTTMVWRTECAVPVGPPWNKNGCWQPSGHEVATVWCCAP
jgi:hypothetical protein